MNEPDDDDLDFEEADYAQMELATYRRLAGPLPTPSAQQIEAFVDFVAHAHSWYKHMRSVSPTSTLQCFMDPHAGTQRVGHGDGTVSVEWRAERGFHYSWLPTAQYRQDFGHLAFSTAQGTSVSMRSKSGDWLIPADDAPVIFNEANQALELLPPEVLSAGAAKVSGLIHTLGADSSRWAHRLVGQAELPTWPEESGGSATMELMRDRCAELRANRHLKEEKQTSGDKDQHALHLSLIDFRFYQLVKPERDRQLAGITTAIQRVISLLAEPQRPTNPL